MSKIQSRAEKEEASGKWVWQDLNLWPRAYQARALTNWATGPFSYDGGGNRIRTDDILLAKQALYQLSYTPKTTYQLITDDQVDKYFQVMKRLKSALRAFF